MEEIWKDISGYEGVYRVSNMGRVLSVRFGPKNVSPRKNAKPKVMSISRSSTGYFHVQLYKQGKASTKLVHKLVAEAFIPNPHGKPEVNHIDGDKANNCVSNLEWVTKSANQRHAIKLGLRSKSPMTGRTGALAPTSRPVVQYDLKGSFIRRWDSRADAARFYGCNACNISGCVTGHHKTCKGYLWRNPDAP